MLKIENEIFKPGRVYLQRLASPKRDIFVWNIIQNKALKSAVKNLRSLLGFTEPTFENTSGIRDLEGSKNSSKIQCNLFA